MEPDVVCEFRKSRRVWLVYVPGDVRNAVWQAELTRRFGARRLRMFVQLSEEPLGRWPDGVDYILRFRRDGERVANPDKEWDRVDSKQTA